MSGSDDPGKGIIAERLDHLFATMTPGGRPYSLREAADGINARAGKDVVSFQYLSLLRSGAKRQPSYEKLQAIASFFGVSADYFTDAEVARRTDEELRGLELMRSSGVRSVMFRMAGVSEDNLKLIVGMLDQIRSAEGLPPAGESGRDGEPPAPGGPEFRPPV